MIAARCAFRAADDGKSVGGQRDSEVAFSTAFNNIGDERECPFSA